MGVGRILLEICLLEKNFLALSKMVPAGLPMTVPSKKVSECIFCVRSNSQRLYNGVCYLSNVLGWARVSTMLAFNIIAAVNVFNAIWR